MIYLDNSATTELSGKVKETIRESLEFYGNPSSLHSMGDEARKRLLSARASVLKSLGVKNGKIIFTSCGSEATNLALLGCAASKSRRTADRVITTDSEHPSVLNALEELSRNGYEIVKIPTAGGCLDFGALEKALDKPVALASIMLVNNETGARYDVEKAFSMIKAKNPDVVLHCDAVQGYLKVGFTPASLGADFVTVSGHKIHAPKGVGALWVSDRIIKEKRLVPRLLGGGQEDGFRSGTENTIGISAFAAAAEEGYADLPANIAYLEGLRAYTVSELSKIDGIKLNLPAVTAPHVLSVTMPGIKSQTVLNFLSARGICVSSGSACSSRSNRPSGTLIAFGLTPLEADSTIRVSFSRYNTKNDVDALSSALEDAIKTLVRIKK